MRAQDLLKCFPDNSIMLHLRLTGKTSVALILGALLDNLLCIHRDKAVQDGPDMFCTGFFRQMHGKFKLSLPS